MTNLLSSIIVAIITSILTVLGTLYVQKRKNENSIRKSSLYLYLNLRQTKEDIDKDKKVVDNAGEKEIFPMDYFSSFDYIAVLTDLKDKMSEREIMTVNNFYENVKKLDSDKRYLFNIRNLHNNYQSMNPASPSPYEQQYKDSYTNFEHRLNILTNSSEYKTDIIEINAKLKRMKDK